MVENKICIGCQWNNYPTCSGTIMDDGNEMNIENLRSGFQCGQKDDVNITDFSIVKKSVSELKMKELEARIMALEKGV